jgi:hypothetical protein
VVVDIKLIPAEKNQKLKIPKKCPICKNKLIMNGPGWGFCDMCVAEITLIEEDDNGKE